VPADAGRWLAATISDSQFESFSGGHAPFLTQPERFNTILFNWWSSL